MAERSLLTPLALAALLLGGGLNFSVSAQSSKQAAIAANNDKLAKQTLAKGLFYHNNDAVNDEAARQLQLVISKYRGTEQAETAQYYLGSYHHRKYYILKDRYAKTDAAALKQAEAAYQAYVNAYSQAGKRTWLAEAHFNLALIYLQRGEAHTAAAKLKELSGVAGADQTVYLYQVVWSPRQESVVDYYVSTQELAAYTSSLLADNAAAQKGPAENFNALIARLTTWCQGRRSRRAAS